VAKAQEIYDGDEDKEEDAPALDKMLDFCEDLVSCLSFGLPLKRQLLEVSGLQIK